MSESSDSDDWYDKDEEEILEKLRSAKVCESDSVEYVTVHSNAADDFNTLHSKFNNIDNVARVATSDLRRIEQLAPLDVFLYVFSREPNFLGKQVHEKDSVERVLSYVHIFAILCRLELLEYHEEILRSFARNDVLLKYMRDVFKKIFSKRYNSSWADEKRVHTVISDMQTLLLQVHYYSVHTAKTFSVMRSIKELIKTSDNPKIALHSICVEFVGYLEQSLSEENLQKKILEGKQSYRNTNEEIYPTLDELKFNCADSNDSERLVKDRSSIVQHTYKNVADYILIQKQLLREDFMIPLRACVQMLQTTRQFNAQSQLTLYNDVFIVLNEQFLSANRHELVFVDVLGSRRTQALQLTNNVKKDLAKLKSGALLCFSTSCAFENLILATVTYTDADLVQEGYVGIEIARQHNIGNIFDRKLVMFETPAFFEPYNNVYKFLSTCSADTFPMKEFIVFGEKNIDAPTYLCADSVYKYENERFRPLKESLPPNLPLNISQQTAYSRALTQKLCLIQGPPGTGKTHLSVQLMHTLIENATTPIALITYTNESLDKFLVKLSTYTDSIVRFGGQIRVPEVAKYNVRNVVGQGSINPDLKRLYYLTNVKFKGQFEKLQKLRKEFDGTDESFQQILGAQKNLNAIAHKLKCIRMLFHYYLARDKSVIAMTTTYAAKANFLLRLLKTSVVMFEEAAEILESHVVASLTPYTQHVIMIGDHLQLQPYTSSYQHSHSYEMNVSLFERLIRRGLNHVVLKTQYRMTPIIAELICPTIYNELLNNDVVYNYPPVQGMAKNLFFVTHEYSESKHEDESSICNEHEVNEIVNLAQFLIHVGEYTTADIVVLCPYARQIQIIQNRFGKFPQLQGIKAATVDSFQGLEANIVLLTLVRSNTNEQIGFLKENNRICVALSRAKHGLYIIGNMSLLSKCSSTWVAIQQTLIANNAIGTEFPYSFTT